MQFNEKDTYSLPSCSVCGSLRAAESWGEGIPWMNEPSAPAPPAFARLEWCGSRSLNLYRCPACGAYFDLDTRSSYFDLSGNSSWDNHTLSRHRPHSVRDLDNSDVNLRSDAAR